MVQAARVHLSLRSLPTRVLFGAIIGTLLLVIISVTSCDRPGTQARRLGSVTGADDLPAPAPAPLPTATPTPMPAKTPSRPRPSTSTRPPAPPAPSTWIVAGGGTGVVGPGSKGLMTYRVEVERAANVDPAGFAATVDATLAGSRGWINEGWAFQRSPAGSTSMVVRLATPATVDRLCAPLVTAGQVSCRTGNLVVINLRRWTEGVPDYAGDLASYRTLVINHEVGHRLGHAGHPSCPGAGLPQPVMMQVFYQGVAPCQKNVWPYAPNGTYLD